MQFHIEPPLPPEFANISFDESQLKEWLITVILEEKRVLTEAINFVFCSDAYLHKVNVEYLDHDTLTDIITFDNSDNPQEIEGDIFISLERIKENAQTFEVAFEEELKRVLVHGILHLIGYNDKTETEQFTMSLKENLYLEKFPVK